LVKMAFQSFEAPGRKRRPGGSVQPVRMIISQIKANTVRAQPLEAAIDFLQQFPQTQVGMFL